MWPKFTVDIKYHVLTEFKIHARNCQTLFAENLLAQKRLRNARLEALTMLKLHHFT